MKSKLFSVVFAVIPFILWSSDLSIENIRPIYQPELNREPPNVQFDLTWNNAWKNDKNHDAIWVFTKFTSVWDAHPRFTTSGHKVLFHFGNEVALDFKISPDSLGLMISLDEDYRGDISCRIQVFLDTTSQQINWRKINTMTVHGVEMVYIPSGPFTLGSPDKSAIRNASFYRSDGNGEPDGLVTVDSEEPIQVGKEKGNLYYWSEEVLYNGDQQGVVPAQFPKGFDAFYVMKYELTQGQYVQFLNRIPDNDTYIRSPQGGKDYYKKRGSIYFKDGVYMAKDPHRPMNYISWEDAMAYSDWAALRPITELEYTKAARGPEIPIPYQMVWGTDNMHELVRHNKKEGTLVLDHGLNEADLNDGNRPKFGASYYWVMDLSGSVWEKVITIGNPEGREFTGNHGDGSIEFGKANVEGWPLSNDEKGGYGYRGGGFYESNLIGQFNPHSPIGYRYYGSWSGGPRYVAYGYRAGRSAW